jgi:F-type H+-transporting ATPase subunit a
VVWLSFSIFVGFIQAFIFTMLSIAYVSQAVANDH